MSNQPNGHAAGRCFSSCGFRLMSLHNHFGKVSHPGFTRKIDPVSAKRQLHVSVGVAAVLGLAIAGSVAVVRPASGFDAQAQHAQFVAAAAVAHQPISAEARINRAYGG